MKLSEIAAATGGTAKPSGKLDAKKSTFAKAVEGAEITGLKLSQQDTVAVYTSHGSFELVFKSRHGFVSVYIADAEDRSNAMLMYVIPVDSVTSGWMSSQCRKYQRNIAGELQAFRGIGRQ